MTLEEAQDRILELQDQVTQLTNERDTLSQNNTDLSTELDSVRKLNQKYFNKLSAQSQKQEEEEPEETAPTCEEFARTLNIF